MATYNGANCTLGMYPTGSLTGTNPAGLAGQLTGAGSQNENQEKKK